MGALTPRWVRRRSWRAISTMPMDAEDDEPDEGPVGDRAAQEGPVDLVQSPLPRKIMGIARLSGKVSIIP
jgi:hypothetical protein